MSIIRNRGAIGVVLLFLGFLGLLRFELLSRPTSASPLDSWDADIDILMSNALSAPAPQKPWNLVICTMFHNEASHLAHWVTYHYLLGVDHFILHNFRSDDGFNAVLAPFIAVGLVELHDASDQDASRAASGDLFLDPCGRTPLHAKARRLGSVSRLTLAVGDDD